MKPGGLIVRTEGTEAVERCDVRFGDATVCTVYLGSPDAAGARRPVVELASTAGLRLVLSSFEVVVGGTRLRLGPEGLVVDTPGTVEVIGERGIELWGGERPDRSDDHG